MMIAMRNLVLPILLAGVIFGCDRNASAPAPVTSQVPAPVRNDAEITDMLLRLVRGHNLPASLENGWVRIEGTPVRMGGGIQGGNEGGEKKSVIVQLAMRLALDGGLQIEQPVVGFGDNRAAAIEHAEASFVLGTFHAWLAAFVNANEDHVRPQERTIGDRKRLVTQGDIVMKALGEQPKDDHRWRDQLLAAIDATDLPRGTHWIDVYHGVVKGEKHEMEIQLDGQRWNAIEEKMRDAPWPDNGTFASVRLFLVVQELGDPTRPKRVATTSPAATSSETPRTTVRLPNRFSSFFAERIGSRPFSVT
jgi:hypothetical protein